MNTTEILKKANDLIPGGTQTISKMYGRMVQGVSPAYCSNGYGCILIDDNANNYIDWSSALGAVILGYHKIGLESYNLLSLPHHSEVQLAEELVNLIPSAEMVRFFKTGSDATNAAIRLARYVSNRNYVLCCGYHGWGDWYCGTLPYPASGGVPPYNKFLVHRIEYGNIDIIEQFFSVYPHACFIMETMDRSCPEKANKEYLQKVRQLCDKYDVMLIFDEMIMGFRYHIAGGEGYYGVTPDLSCYGKAIGNGAPISALTGKKDIMKKIQDLHITGTHFSEIGSIMQALDTINYILGYNVIEELNVRGSFFIEKLKAIIRNNAVDDIVRVKGFGPWNSFVWKKEHIDSQQLFNEIVLNNGIFLNRDHFMNYSHTKEIIEKTIKIYDNAFCIIKESLAENSTKAKLKGHIDPKLFPMGE